MSGDFGGDEFAECVADGGRGTDSRHIADGGVVGVIDRVGGEQVGGEQVLGGVDGGVPVAQVDLGLAVDGADALAGFVVAGGVGVVPEFYCVFPVVACFGAGCGVGVPGAVGVVVVGGVGDGVAVAGEPDVVAAVSDFFDGCEEGERLLFGVERPDAGAACVDDVFAA